MKSKLTVEEIKKFVGDRLAQFKVPKLVNFVDRLPLNPIGKVDKLALSEACMSAISRHELTTLPTTPIEKVIHAIWARELPPQEFGIHDEFTVLGGDSLSSIRILVAIERECGIEVDEEDIHSLTTVAALAEYVAQRM